MRAVLRALAFAAERHRDQRRKGAGGPPFINHAIEIADLIASVGGITDAETLQAAVLHDTLEDTDTSPDELEAEFGPRVRRIVEEVTDDLRLPPEEWRRRQVESAPGLSSAAKIVRLADKIANVRAVALWPPVGWSLERRRDYVAWSERVVAGCRGVSPELEAHYDEVLAHALEALR